MKVRSWLLKVYKFLVAAFPLPFPSHTAVTDCGVASCDFTGPLCDVCVVVTHRSALWYLYKGRQIELISYIQVLIHKVIPLSSIGPPGCETAQARNYEIGVL